MNPGSPLILLSATSLIVAELFLVLEDQRIELVGQRKHDMEVLHRQ
jgi:hypothetical protein